MNVDLRTNVSILSQFEKKIKLGGKKMKKYNELDKMIMQYFNELSDDYGLKELYSSELSEEEITEKQDIVFKYFKAGFLFANIHAE